MNNFELALYEDRIITKSDLSVDKINNLPDDKVISVYRMDPIGGSLHYEAKVTSQKDSKLPYSMRNGIIAFGATAEDAANNALQRYTENN